MAKRYTQEEVDEKLRRLSQSLVAKFDERIAETVKQFSRVSDRLGRNPYREPDSAFFYHSISWDFGNKKPKDVSELTAFEMIEDIHKFLGVNYDESLKAPTLTKAKKATKPAAKKKSKTKK